MDGVDLCLKLKKMQTEGQIHPDHVPYLIALTANSQRDRSFYIDTIGMDGYLAKPIDVEELRSVLAKFSTVDKLKTMAVI
jgi:CheY-like chemotaxis protein